MPDKLMRAQVTIGLDSGIPEDAIVNTFYFDGDQVAGDLNTDDEWHTAAFNALSDFYEAIDGLIFPASILGTAVVKLYDMRDPEPRVVEYQNTITLTPSADPPLPNEMALCLSFQAQAISGELQRRRRGRVFLGPYRNHEDAVSVIGGQARPSLLVRQAVVDAANSLKTTPLPGAAGDNVHWAVYSRTTDDGTGSPDLPATSIDDAFHDVDNGWCDDAFDVQRRRGAGATARVLFG